MTTPAEILKELFPALIDCARYADLLQHRIEAVPDKEGAPNIFAAALSDADLSIQAAVELSVLSKFPGIPFFGEEWKSSRNTKYLAGTNFIDASRYLITLDPIDGTRLYLDRKKLYQIILTVVSRKRFEAALIMYPAFNDYVYALKGNGAWKGSLSKPFSSAKPWRLKKGSKRVFVAGEFHKQSHLIADEYNEVHTSANYRHDTEMHYLSSAVRNELSGALIGSAQVIDGAALAFVAGEMGYFVKTHDGKPMPAPGEFPELVLPGLIVGEDKKCWETLKRLV